MTARYPDPGLYLPIGVSCHIVTWFSNIGKELYRGIYSACFVLGYRSSRYLFPLFVLLLWPTLMVLEFSSTEQHCIT